MRTVSGDARLALELAVRSACAAGALAREALEAWVHVAAVILEVGVAELDDVVGLDVAAVVDCGRGGAHDGRGGALVRIRLCRVR